MAERQVDDLAPITAALSVPFPKSAIQIKQVPGQRPLSYVAGHTYIHRLIDATANHWDWQIKSFEPRPYGATRSGNAQLLLIVTGTLTIPGLGSRDGMGVQVVTAETGGEDMWKGAQTDAIKAAAKLFGVGLELYGPDYEAFEAPDDNPGIADRRPAPGPHTEINGQALRSGIVEQSKANEASRNDTPERRKNGLAAVFAAGQDRGLKQGEIKALCYWKFKVESMTELTADQLGVAWKWINETPPRDLKDQAEDLVEAAMEAEFAGVE